MATYDVKFTTYSGMTSTLGTALDKEEVKELVKTRLRRAINNDQPYNKVGKGEWELETPEDAFGISDNDGFLRFHRHYNNRSFRRAA